MMRTAIYSILLAAFAGFASAENCGPSWKETVGNSSPDFAFHQDSIEILEQTGDTVEFSVSQKWSQPGTPMFAVHYRNFENEDICDMEASQDLVAFGTSKTYTATCYHGVADVSIYMYVGDNANFVEEECEACKAPDDDYVGHYLTIPCIQQDDCQDTPRIAEEVCICEAGMDEVESFKCGQYVYVCPSLETIAAQNGNEGSSYYRITQEQCDYMKTLELGEKCLPLDNYDPPVPERGLSHRVCYDSDGLPTGKTDSEGCGGCDNVKVPPFETPIADPDPPPAITSPPTDEPSDSPTESMAKVNPPDEDCYELCRHDIPDCFEGPLTTLSDIGTEDEVCIYGEMPISITNMADSSVGFDILDTWQEGAITSISLSYTNRLNEVVCMTTPPGEGFDGLDDIVAMCDEEGIATIVMSVHSADISYQASAIENACAVPDTGGTCSYEVALPCKSMMVCGATESPSEDPTGSPSESPTGSPSSSPSGSFYPSSAPTSSPSASPAPSKSPTGEPSESPTASPSLNPTLSPTNRPTHSPTASPSGSPTGAPSDSPTPAPTVSAAPTDCMGVGSAVVVNALCFDGDEQMSVVAMPEDALVLTDVHTDSVQFTISPAWEEAVAMSVKHSNEDFEDGCAIYTEMETMDFSATCVEGMTTASVIVHYGTYVGSDCDACDVGDLSEMGGKFCAYNIDIPCTPVSVECGEPSAAPSSGPTATPSASPSDSPTTSPSDSPTASPSDSPTKSPTDEPSESPSGSFYPSSAPSDSPTKSPAPSDSPTGAPSDSPTAYPTVSSAPTDCMELPPAVVTGICIDGETETEMSELPAGFTFDGIDGEMVSVTVNNKFTDGVALAFKHTGPDFESQCDIHDDVTIGDTFDFEATCATGVTTVVAIVYYDEFEEDDCVACSVADITAMGDKYCAYSIEIQCEPESVECGEPSAAPSGSFYPSSAPSDSPTKSSAPSASPTTSPSASPTGSPSGSPTDYPTAFPTGSPSSTPSESPTDSPTGFPTNSPSSTPTASPSVSMSPTMCSEPMPPKVVESVCKSTSGAEMPLIPMPDNALTIGDLLDDTVGVTVTQTWTDVAGVAVQSGMDMCIVNGDVAFGVSEDLSAECIEGYASLTVVAYMDEAFDPDDCEACNVEELSEMGGNYEFCAYRIEIPCDTVEVPCGEPSAAPSGSFYPSSQPTESPSVSMAPSSSPTYSCPDNVELVHIDGAFEYPADAPPIVVTFSNETHVQFHVDNVFGQTVSNVFTERHSGLFGETECLEEENFEVDDAPIEFTAMCMHHVHISIVNLFVMDCEDTTPFLGPDDNAEVPECCHPPDGECKTVQYTFKLHCVDQCPDDAGGRKLHQVDAHKMIEEKKKQEASTKVFEELTGHADDNDADDHFCVVEDYPCGADLDKVHVCHYSARDGYKTFCVPEADSDALRFYPKDYCGPCVGGYSTV